MLTRTYIKTYRTFTDPDYFHIENLYNGNNTLTLTKTGTPASTDLQYRMGEDGEWNNVDLTTSKTTYVLAAGGKVYFRSTTGFSKDDSNYFKFSTASSSYKIAAHGDIVSLFNYLEIGKPFAMPTYGCYYMFSGCSSLTTAPDLSGVTSIGSYGCYYMFRDCSSLTTAPDLTNVTNIGSYGCSEMFFSCGSLTTAPDMSNVTSIGSSGCSYMFYGGRSLTTAPDLTNVTSIGSSGCEQMFRYCSSLNYVYAPSPSSWSTSNMNVWLDNVAQYGIVRKKSTLTIPTDSTSGIPTGWDVENY